MKNRNIIIAIIIILISGSFFTSCGSSDSELEKALENANVSSPAEFNVNAGDDQIVTLDETVTLNGDKSSDPNSNALTYFWEFVSMPTGSTISLINQTTVNPTFNPDTVGVYEISLTVNNGTESKTDVIEITVNEVSGVSGTNTAPVANAGDDNNVSPNDTVELNGSGSSDVDGDSITYIWAFVSRPVGSTAVITDSTSVEPTFLADNVGLYEIQLTVNDGQSSSSDIVLIKANTAPIANAGVDFAITINTPATLNGNGSSDIDGDDLTYVWAFVSRPAGSTVVLNNTVVVEPVFTPDMTGVYEISLTVNDGTDSNTDTVIITAGTDPVVNNAPVANAGADQVLTLGGTITLNGTGSYDPDSGDVLVYLWEIVSQPVGSNAFFNNSALIEPLLYADTAGDYEVRLIVNDDSASHNDLVNIKVNTVPVASAGSDFTVTVNRGVTLNGRGSSDADGDSLTNVWFFVSRPVGSAAAFNNSTSVEPSFTPDIVGVYEISLSVNDGNDSHSDTIIVTASAEIVPNNTPIANAGTDQAMTPGSTITLNGTGSSDPDSDTLTYLWEIITQPDGSNAFLNDSMLVEPRFIADTVGTYELRLTVNDGNASHSDVVVITANTMPAANAGEDQTVTLTDTVTLNGNGSTDPDGDTITYLWAFVSRPGGSMAALTNETTVNPTFTADTAGTYAIRLTVNDGNNAHADTVNIMVNTVPVANAGEDQSVALNSVVTLYGSGSSDPDGDNLTYSWALVSPDGSTSVLTGVNPTFTADVAGIYEINLTVNDGIITGTDTVRIVVNTEPSADAGEDQAVILNDTVTLYGNESTDPDGNDITYSWALVSPDGSTSVLTGVNPTFIADKAGVYRVTLTVYDGKDTNTDTVSITTINNVPIADAGNYAKVPYDSSVTLDGVGSTDADGDELSYSWTLLERPTDSIASLNDNEIKAPSFDADAYGRYLIGLVVNDGHVNSAPDTVELIVGTVPDTGQTTCYNTAGDVIPCSTDENAPFYGQDAHYSIYPPSYTKLDSNGNDLSDNATDWVMVRDNVTGLIWEVKTDGGDGSVHDKYNTYTWYDSNSATNGGYAGTPGDGTDTEDFIQNLNDNNFGGFSDWRLPNVKELKSIVDNGRDRPTVNGDYFKNTTTSQYWSSTTVARNNEFVWPVYFGIGLVLDSSRKNNACYVRAVRGGQQTPSFTDNNDGTITDHNTGLIWMQATADTDGDGDLDLDDRLNWENALSYCEALIFAEQSDWRLPTVKELQSIVDYNHYTPAIDTAYFPNTMSYFYWSSTTYVVDTGVTACRVDFSHGSVSQYSRFFDKYVRAVRGGQ